MILYVDAHTHTDRSNTRGFLDSINTIEGLITYTKELGHSGVAITDHDTIGCHMDAINTINDLKKKDPEKWKNYKNVKK